MRTESLHRSRRKQPENAWRWTLSSSRFILLAALANTALYHQPIYEFASSNLDTRSANGVLTLLTAFVLVTFMTTLTFGLLSLLSEKIIKPLFMGVAICNSVALYFIQTYSVILDKSMMGNVFNTDVSEASALFHPALLVYIVCLGILPCVLISRVTLSKTSFLRRTAFTGIVLVAGLGWAYANSNTALWFSKNGKRLGGLTLPWSYVINGGRNLAGMIKPAEQKQLPIATMGTKEKTVVVLLIGEAARSESFSLYGYPRLTNPELSKAGVVALPHARSCATYTTESLLCILSHLDTGDSSWEPLSSYLQRSGVDVIWRANNWGEPAMKVETFQRSGDLKTNCNGDDCNYDEVLLNGLAERIRSSRRDKVFVVLHLAGSHGPVYYTKYPARFETFKPVCKSVDLHKCTKQELINAYDNSIVYTDHVVAQTIALLKAFPQVASSLIYLSDHGESLGEYGLYLHGTPYSIAPDVQKDIPFIVWMSEEFKRHKHIRPPELSADARHSQANVFHSVMGAFDMHSEIYRPDRDIFSAEEIRP
jgi:lipid A ethanolaminephosphotransferase